MRIAGASQDVDETENLTPFVMRRFAELSMSEQRGKYPQVSVSQNVHLARQIKQVPYDDIQQHMEIICVKILVRRRCGKKQVQQFENEQLLRGLCFSVEKQYDILSKGSIGISMNAKKFDDAIGGGRDG